MKQELILNLVIGALGSILASIIIALVLQTFEFGAKEKIRMRLAVVAEYAFMIRNRYCYVSDYYETVHCAEEIMRLIREITDHVKRFNLLGKKENRKIFFTLLYDMQRRCERICFQTVGYDGEQEIQARINRIQREQFNQDEDLFLEKECNWLLEIVDGKTPQYDNDVIDIDSFCLDEGDTTYIRKKGIRLKRYQEMVEECQRR